MGTTYNYYCDPKMKRSLEQTQQKNNQLMCKLSNLQQMMRSNKLSKQQLQKFKKENKETKEQLDRNEKQLTQLKNESKKNNQQLLKLKKQNMKNQNALDSLTKNFNQQQQQLKKLKDPKKIEQASKQLFKIFVGQLQPFNVYNPIPKGKNLKYVAVIGENSAGKSSIYNWMFGLNLKVGVDDTTQQIQVVHSFQNIWYFDSPGLNEYADITNAETLKAFYCIDYIFVATAVTFKKSVKAIQVFHKIDPPKFYLVRSQCDKFKNDQQFEQAAAKDKKVLASIGVKREILYISTMKPDSYKDNAKFKSLMMDKM